jgi:hypothetical protein
MLEAWQAWGKRLMQRTCGGSGKSYNTKLWA